MLAPINVHGRMVGSDNPCFVIAEAGVNHNGNLDLAHKLVDAAKAAGADAVKFQTFNAERLVSRMAPKAEYQLENTDHAESQFDMLSNLELSEAAHRELMAHCAEKNLIFMSTPFDEKCADLLADLGMCAYKISSAEITNIPFLDHVARKHKPLIVSTGMATLLEVETVVETVHAAGCRELILLQCTSNYPADPRDVNLRAMCTMAETFHVPIGYSDHTTSTDISLAAVALGACVIEKHFTLDRNLHGPDHQASLEPNALKLMISSIRRVENALGDGVKRPASSELVNLPISRKSVHWRRALAVGSIVGQADLICLRPGTGVAPCMLPSLVGRRLRRAVFTDQMVNERDFK